MDERTLQTRVTMRGMSDRALSFGASAEAYERFRPGYPPELIGLVTAYAGSPIRTALEIGAGTGKATRLFAAHGIAVTATDPDAAMLAELRRHVPAGVTTHRAAFEDLRLRGKYQLVFAAAALHWTDPVRRWPRMAGLLEPGGVFTAFGAPLHLADPALENAVRDARTPFLPSDDIPTPSGPAPAPAPSPSHPAPAPSGPAPSPSGPAAPSPPDRAMQWPGPELEHSPWFTDVRQSVITRRLTLTASDYIGHLSTISAYLTLPPPLREEAFRSISAVLPEAIEINADVTVHHLARRRSNQRQSDQNQNNQDQGDQDQNNQRRSDR
ncbi:class I SAM-dependent methyltransferase [Winogradskya humida]|nr:class I SAM-dependent methyltransferase [Actinoplanes humidus]